MMTLFPSLRTINPLAPQTDQIDIRDIAHALSQINRFNGHAKRPISVAQHSVYVSRLCEPHGCALQGLLHDASEAYLGDVTKWLKQTPEFAGYRAAEDRLQRFLFRHFGCPEELAAPVEWADKLMVRFEVTKVYHEGFVIDGLHCNNPAYGPLTPEEREKIGPWGHWRWRQAEELFLYQYRWLTGVSEAS